MDKLSWLYLDLNSFFASCEQQENPKLRGKPIAIVPMLADTTSCLAASYPAKKYGVKTGTKVFEAKKMCPGIVFVKSNHDTYVRYHHKILAAVESCVPIEGIHSIDEISCRLTGSQQNEEVARDLAKKIKLAIKDQVGEAITASIGLSTNPFLAKIATDMQKPNGLTVIHKKDLPQKLYSLSLRDIPGIGFKMEKNLLEKKVFTVEQLCSFSQKEMALLWGGVWGDRLYLWLRGEEVALPATKNRSLSHEHVLPPDKRSAKAAHEIAKKLLTKLCVRMRRGGFYTKSLGVHVKFIGQPSTYWETSARFHEVRDTHSLIKKLKELWGGFPEGKKPLRVGVVCSDLISQDFHQFSFFDNPKLDEVSRVMDKINKKYGRETLHLGATHKQKDAAPTQIAFRRIPDLDEL